MVVLMFDIIIGIGVSNFTITQMNEIIKYSDLNNLSYKVPTLLQNECHPYLQNKDIIDYCNAFGIQFQAYSVLGSGETNVAMDTPPAESLLPQINGQIPLKNPVMYLYNIFYIFSTFLNDFFQF